MKLPLSFTSAIISISLIANCVVVNCDEDEVPENQRPIRQVAGTTAKPGEPRPPVTAAFPLKDLILILMAKHGDAQTALAFNSLDKRSLGQIMKILLVEVDAELGEDIVAMQHHAQNSDKELVAVIARIVTGDGAVAKDIFSWDEKLRKFPWWARIRQRMFVNLDKYVSAYKASIS